MESLKKPIEQMKTSIFYPNTSLPVFLHGPTGSGKSFMARKIYEFAVQEGILKPDAPFIIMNCAQYVNNIELLSSNLFGYVKGAFTGAYATTKGLLEAADGGMLFLDEVHRLNSESQEKLFVFLDQGIFRRMGESEGWHKAKSADGHGYHRKFGIKFSRYIFKKNTYCCTDTFFERERRARTFVSLFTISLLEESKVVG